MYRASIMAAILALSQVTSSAVQAGPERVKFPKGYVDAFINYGSLDKQGLNTIRRLYIKPDVLGKIRRGKPLPDGTVLILEELTAALGADGEARRDEAGSFIPTGEVKQVLVAEKRAGWGDAYQDETLMAGDWEFAAFSANGSRKIDADQDACRTCHQQASTFDYTFSLFPRLEAVTAKAD